MSNTVSRTTTSAKISVISRATSSPLRSRRKSARGPQERPAASTVVGTVAITELLNHGNGFFFLGNDFLRQLGVSQRLAVLLSCCQHPVQEIFDGVPLCCILDLSGNQQPSEAGDGISSLSGSVSNGDTKIVGHGFGRTSRSSGNAGQTCLHELAGRILYRAVGKVVLNGVNQLDITDGVRRLFEQACDSFVTLTT